MGPIPEDLIVVLLFAAFVLVQILRGRRRSKARRTQAKPVAATPADIETPSETEAETPVQSPWAPAQVEGPQPKPAVHARQVLLAARPQARRFSRRSLMGNRRSLQEAIVVATILGPCLAHRPHDPE